EARLAELSRVLVDRDGVQHRVAAAEAALGLAEQAAQQVVTLEAELGQRQRLLRDNGFAVEARRGLAVLDRQVSAIGYDADNHAALRARAASLAGADREHQLLEQAQLSASHLDAQIAELTAQLARLEEECSR